MKHYLLFLFVISFAACNAQQKQETHQKETALPRLTLTAEFLRTSYNSYEKPVKYTRLLDTLRDKHFEVALTLKNNTDTAISFWMMNCSFTNSFDLSDTLFYFHNECDKNFPVIKTLMPEDSLVFMVTLLRSLPANSLINDALWTYRKKQKTRFAFVLADAKINKKYSTTLLINEDDIFWSNALALEIAQ